MSQQPLFINFLTGQPIAKDLVTVTDPAFGAHADGVRDDSTAIQSAINSLPNGGTVYFPTGTYAIGAATAITLPNGKGITLLGAGRGDPGFGPGTQLKAIASITSVIGSGTVFTRGHRISSMTIDGNALAQYCIKMDQSQASLYDNLNIYNATLINFRLGDGTHATQENVLFSIRVDNPAINVFANLPTYNLELNGDNNDVVSIKLTAAQTANFHSGSTSVNNKYVNLHGYGAPSGAPTNQFLFDGGGEQLLNYECDGSASVNIQINSFQNTFAGGYSQFQGVTAQKHVQFATGTAGNIFSACTFANTSDANCFVQVGTPAAHGNSWVGCYNGNSGNILQSIVDTNASYSKQVPVTGFTINVTNFQSELILDPAGALAAGTVNLPTSPGDGQTFRLASTQTITTLTMGAVGTIKNALTTIAGGGAAMWRYVAANTTWYRIE